MMLTFESYQAGEEALYLQLVTDLQVMAYITERALSQKEGLAEFAEILAYNRQHRDGSGYFKVSDGATYLGFAKISWAKDASLEVGYMLLPEHWGHGHARQLLSQLLALIAAHPALAAAPVYAVIDPNNGASKHLLDKQGFVSTWVGIEEGLATEYLSYQQK